MLRSGNFCVHDNNDNNNNDRTDHFTTCACAWSNYTVLHVNISMPGRKLNGVEAVDERIISSSMSPSSFLAKVIGCWRGLGYPLLQ